MLLSSCYIPAGLFTRYIFAVAMATGYMGSYICIYTYPFKLECRYRSLYLEICYVMLYNNIDSGTQSPVWTTNLITSIQEWVWENCVAHLTKFNKVCCLKNHWVYATNHATTPVLVLQLVDGVNPVILQATNLAFAVA